MTLFYEVCIGAVLLLGVVHIGFTFIKYPKLEPNALWFMSAGMGLIFCGLINYLHLSSVGKLTHEVTTGANLLLLIFTALLLRYIRNRQIYALGLVSLLLFVGAFLYQ